MCGCSWRLTGWTAAGWAHTDWPLDIGARSPSGAALGSAGTAGTATTWPWSPTPASGAHSEGRCALASAIDVAGVRGCSG